MFERLTLIELCTLVKMLITVNDPLNGTCITYNFNWNFTYICNHLKNWLTTPKVLQRARCWKKWRLQIRGKTTEQGPEYINKEKQKWPFCLTSCQSRIAKGVTENQYDLDWSFPCSLRKNCKVNSKSCYTCTMASTVRLKMGYNKTCKDYKLNRYFS